MKLSACLIAKDEERCIARCIGSYKDIVDEIILVDTGSSDRTVDIAHSLGAKVTAIEWPGDFSIVRNAALELASGDWVLFLDADEWLSEGSARPLRKLLEQTDADESVQGIWIRLYNIGESASYQPLLRLFRLQANIRYQGAVHENVRMDGQPLRAITAPGDTISILHDGYAQGKSLQKAQRNIVLLRARLTDGDTDPMLHFYLAQSYETLQDYAAAKEETALFLARDTAANPLTMRAMLRREKALRLTGAATKEREALATDALARFPAHPSAYVIAANACFEAGLFEDAAAHYKKAVHLHASYSDPLEFSDNLLDAAYPDVRRRLAISLQKSGQSAQDAFIAAMEQGNLAALPGYVDSTLHMDAQSVAAALLAWCGEDAERLNAATDALHAQRPDIAYLLAFEKWFAATGTRDYRFTAMQVVVGEYTAAVNGATEYLLLETPWLGSYAASESVWSEAERKNAARMLCETVCGALIAMDATLLGRLRPLSPPALQDALSLSLGEDVEALRRPGYDLCAAIAERLRAHNAPEAQQGMWQEILSFF